MFILVVLVLSILLFKFLYDYCFYWWRKGVPSIKESSFKKSLEVLFLRTAIWKHIEDIYYKYDEKFIGFFMLNNPAVFVKDLNLIKRILLSDFEYFPDRTLGRNPDADTLGAHILFLTRGWYWKYMRKKVTQAYSTSRINLQVPLMDSIAKNLCKFIESHGNKPVEMKEACAKYSTDVITTSAYGIEGNSFKDGKDNYRTITQEIFPASLIRNLHFSFHYVAPFLLKYFGMTFLNKGANVRLEKTYWEQMKIKMVTGENRNDFLDFIIEVSKKESDLKLQIGNKAMVSQAAQYFLAGFETIGSNLAYCLYELAKQPDLQARLREEIQEVMKAHNGVLSSHAIKDMTYLDMVLNETMRLYPILPFLDRKLVKDYKIPDSDVILEKGTNIYISMRGMSYDPKYFPDPHKFDPDRFSRENKPNIEPYTFMAFGAGPRTCIGARYGQTTIKVALIRVLMDFEVKTTAETTKKIDYYSRSFVLVPIQDILLTYEKINS